MYILGISCLYHESAAALLLNGKIIAAAAQERFSRIKHDSGFPLDAIRLCLRRAGITAKDLSYVVYYEKPFGMLMRHLVASASFFPRSFGYFSNAMQRTFNQKLWIKSIIVQTLQIPNDRVLFVPHHLSHAAASFFPSPFGEAAFLSLDAVGDTGSGLWGIGEGNMLHPVAQLPFPHSVGLWYSAFTAFLGFTVNDGEYKVMGMAGYGKPRYRARVRKTYRMFPGAEFSLNLEYFAFHTTAQAMYSELFTREFLGCDRFDLAASVQKEAEEIVLAMMIEVAQKTTMKNLCFGGGVALNSVINGLVTKRTPFNTIYIFPASGDDGAAAGAALYVYHHVLGHAKRHALSDMFMGVEYADSEIAHFLKSNRIAYKKMSTAALCRFVVDYLVRGYVIGWFEGRAEYGPRALGHRSILADPKSAKMKDIVNTKIKFREEFRPFAPAVLEELADIYFPGFDKLLAPFMLATYKASLQAKTISPATVHVDGTSRIQTVGKSYPGLYRTLIEEFYRRTKRPILLNTSFNLKGEPIVNSPKDAYRTFVRSGIDVLVLGKYVIVKSENSRKKAT